MRAPLDRLRKKNVGHDNFHDVFLVTRAAAHKLVEMKKPRTRLYVARPCTAETSEALVATGKDRWHCSHCEKDVHDLRRATEIEARAVVALFGTNLCGRLRVDDDGDAIFRPSREQVGRGFKIRRDLAAATMTTILGTSTVAYANDNVGSDEIADARALDDRAPPDRDHDGVPDAHDQCPDSPETRNGFNDDDGCPDQSPDDGHIDGGMGALPERVRFERNASAIRRGERDLLVAVASVLNSRPDITQVRVVGYAETRERNAEALAAARANAVVDALISSGVDRARLIAERATSHNERTVLFDVSSV